MEELDWSAERQVLIPAEHLCVTLNADLEPEIHHQTPMTYGYILDTVISYTSKLLQQRWKYIFLVQEIMFPSLLPQFGSAVSLQKKGVSQYFIGVC